MLKASYCNNTSFTYMTIGIMVIVILTLIEWIQFCVGTEYADRNANLTFICYSDTKLIISLRVHVFQKLSKIMKKNKLCTKSHNVWHKICILNNYKFYPITKPSAILWLSWIHNNVLKLTRYCLKLVCNHSNMKEQILSLILRHKML